uniref:Uncharacterized protein n=1 Tax=Ditylum brightwellii TaxID=49249 RepID=A0A7S4W1C6_9STRA
MLIDREINNRKRAFGVELYDHVQTFSTRPEFYSSDDLLTATLRPPLLQAQREIAALEIKRGKVREEMAQAEITRRAAFPVPATNWYEKMANAAKSAQLAGNETRLKAEQSMVEIQMRDYKENFGLDIFNVLTELEDTRGWLPTDREVRSLYDNARRDVEKAEEKRKKKEQDIVDLGGDRVRDPNKEYSVPDTSVGGNVSASSADSSGMFVMSNPSVGAPPGKGGGFGSSVASVPAQGMTSGSGYGTASGVDVGGGSGYGSSATSAPVFGGGYRPSETNAAPVATAVAAPVDPGFSFAPPNPDPFACFSESTEGSLMGSTIGVEAAPPAQAASSTYSSTTNYANSGLFAGMGGPSSTEQTGATTSIGNSISGALVKASLNNPKAAAGALSAANSISSSLKF